MEESIENLMTEIRGGLELLEGNLPHRVDPMVSPASRLPFKALVYRAALSWRMAELSRGAFESFENNQIARAILLTRAAVETGAGLWYLGAKLDAAVKAGAEGDINDYLMKLMMGSRTNPEMPSAISVLTFVARVEKDVEGFSQQYDLLSEYSHPNWAGTARLYSKPDATNLWTDFGRNIRGIAPPKKVGIINLSVALMFFELSYNRVGDNMPAFIALCENNSKEGGTSDTTETA